MNNIFWEYLNLKIKSETDYYTVRLKIHIIKIIDADVDIYTLLNGTFNEDIENGDKNGFKVPRSRQLSKLQYHQKFRDHVITDQKCTMNMPDYFKDNTIIVKILYCNLTPYDIWDVNSYLHFGPGSYLNRLHD